VAIDVTTGCRAAAGSIVRGRDAHGGCSAHADSNSLRRCAKFRSAEPRARLSRARDDSGVEINSKREPSDRRGPDKL